MYIQVYIRYGLGSGFGQGLILSGFGGPFNPFRGLLSLGFRCGLKGLSFETVVSQEVKRHR